MSYESESRRRFRGARLLSRTSAARRCGREESNLQANADGLQPPGLAKCPASTNSVFRAARNEEGRQGPPGRPPRKRHVVTILGSTHIEGLEATRARFVRRVLTRITRRAPQEVGEALAQQLAGVPLHVLIIQMLAHRRSLAPSIFAHFDVRVNHFIHRPVDFIFVVCRRIAIGRWRIREASNLHASASEAGALPFELRIQTRHPRVTVAALEAQNEKGRQGSPGRPPRIRHAVTILGSTRLSRPETTIRRRARFNRVARRAIPRRALQEAEEARNQQLAGAPLRALIIQMLAHRHSLAPSFTSISTFASTYLFIAASILFSYLVCCAHRAAWRIREVSNLHASASKAGALPFELRIRTAPRPIPRTLAFRCTSISTFEARKCFDRVGDFIFVSFSTLASKSHDPLSLYKEVDPGGLEPPHFRLKGGCSTH